MKRWSVYQKGQLAGPFTLQQLQQMVHAGELKPTDLVCPDGAAPTMANRVVGLFAAPPLTQAAPGSAAIAVPSPPATAVPIRHAAAPPTQPQGQPPIAVVRSSFAARYGILIGAGVFCVILLLGCLPAAGGAEKGEA
jgi:hypothetical protein